MHVLVGVHTAGKTTIGHSVEQEGFLFFPEIAVEQIAGMLPWELGSSFDDQVISKELARDTDLESQASPFFIESWHIGNLAYARTRNPSVASRYELIIKTQVRAFAPIVYFLDLPPDLLRTRTRYFVDDVSKVKAIDFYFRVRTEILRVLKDLGLTYATIDASEGPALVLQRIMEYERSHDHI